MKARMRKMLEIEDGVEMDDEELMSKLEAAMCGYSKKKLDAGAMPEKLMKMEAAKASAESERDSIKAELAAAKSELEAARTEAAESFVAELVASHKIAPKADIMKASLKRLFLTNPTEARDFASELTASNPGNERITDEGNAKNPGESPASYVVNRSAPAARTASGANPSPGRGCHRHASCGRKSPMCPSFLTIDATTPPQNNMTCCNRPSRPGRSTTG
jgi:hypothetical protein